MLLQFWIILVVQTFGFESSTRVIITTLTLYTLSRMPRQGMRLRAGLRGPGQGHTPSNIVQSRKYRSSSAHYQANTVKLADTCIHDTRLTDGGEIILTTQDMYVTRYQPICLCYSHLLPVSMSRLVIVSLGCITFWDDIWKVLCNYRFKCPTAWLVLVGELRAASQGFESQLFPLIWPSVDTHNHLLSAGSLQSVNILHRPLWSINQASFQHLLV